MDKGLWLSSNEFVSLSSLGERKKTHLLEEMYSYSALTGFDPVSFLGLLPDPDPVLRKTGDGIDVLRSLTADDKVLSSIQNRKLGTLKKQDFLYEPGKIEGKDPDKASKDICDRLMHDLDKINLYNVHAQVLEAPYYGQTPVEIIWESITGQLHVADLRPRPVEWFSYNEKHEPVFSGDFENNTVLPDKIVIARHFPDAVNPYGLRLLSRCLWPVAIKKGGIRFWTVLCERFGMPWVIGKVKDKKERAGALSMLTSMVQNAVAVLSGDAEVDVHTFTGKGGDLHASLIRHCDTAIAHVLQGQNLTNEGGSTGSYAESKTSKEALTDFQEADEHLVVSFMNDLAKIYTRVNSSDAMPPVFRYREPDDYIVLADLDTKLHGVGVRFTKEHFKRKYRMTDDEFDLEAGAVEDSDSGSGDGRQAEFSSAQDKFTPDQANLELFCDDLADSASDYTQKVQNSFLKAILSADSYEDAMVKVLELYPEIDAGQLQDLLERGILNSTFYGVYTGQQETDDD